MSFGCFRLTRTWISQHQCKNRGSSNELSGKHLDFSGTQQLLWSLYLSRFDLWLLNKLNIVSAIHSQMSKMCESLTNNLMYTHTHTNINNSLLFLYSTTGCPTSRRATTIRFKKDGPVIIPNIPVVPLPFSFHLLFPVCQQLPWHWFVVIMWYYGLSCSTSPVIQRDWTRG